MGKNTVQHLDFSILLRTFSNSICKFLIMVMLLILSALKNIVRYFSTWQSSWVSIWDTHTHVLGYGSTPNYTTFTAVSCWCTTWKRQRVMVKYLGLCWSPRGVNSWLHPGPALPVEGIWGTGQQMELCLFVSLPFK